MAGRNTSWRGSFVRGILPLVLLWGAVAAGQRGDIFNASGATTSTTPGYENRGDGTVVKLSVHAENGKSPLDRQSLVKTLNQGDQSVRWQTTDDNSQVVVLLPFGKYEFEVSAVGYLSEKRSVEVFGSYRTIPLDITLQRDPAAIDLKVEDAAMPAKARKEAKHAVSELKAGKLDDAKKSLDAAYRLAPSNADLNFLLGYLSYQQKNLAQAQTYLTSATGYDTHHVQAMTLLGRVQLIRENYPAAAATLEKAVEVDSQHWMANNLLADVYLKQKKYADAQQQAELAITKGGKTASGVASLTLGQALINLGKTEDGIRALRTFIDESPKNPAVSQVRDLIEKLEQGPPGPAAANPGTIKNTSSPLVGIDPLLASPEPVLSIKSWQPLGVDDVKPPVAASVACPSETVIQASGERVKEFVTNVSRIAAIEHLLHQRVDDMGNPATRETRDFNYVSSITEDKPGFLGVDEYRAEHLGLSDFPDQIASSGFGALALVFHPTMRPNFDMVCEGLGDFHGQAAWLIHFRQREDHPARLHDYKVGGEIYSLKLKGRAWILADKFQIVRIESELVSPMPAIQLRGEHQVVEYAPVLFKDKNVELWLPKNAEIYLDFRKRRYYRRHSFDHYMLFAVDSQEKRSEPKAPLPDPLEKPPGN